MVSDLGFWATVAEKIQSISDRTRGGARRALRIGVLRIDLVSLRRDRARALTDLGERALEHWNAGAAQAIESDPEALRLRSRIASVEATLEAKRTELERLREELRQSSRAPDPEAPDPEAPVVQNMEAP